MKDFPIDLGTLIAYFVPGYIAIRGLSHVSPSFLSVIRADGADDLLFLVVVSLTIGMVISILRSGSIDYTCRYDLADTLGRLGKGLGLSRGWEQRLPPSWKVSHERTEPRFDKLRTEGALAAFVAAKAEDMRPYQFYGNTLLAVGLHCACRLIAAVFYGASGWAAIRITMLALPVMVALYLAGRLSYFRFMNAVEALNRAGGS